MNDVIPETSKGQGLIDRLVQATIKACAKDNTKAQRASLAKARRALENYVAKLERKGERKRSGNRSANRSRPLGSGKGFMVRRQPSGSYAVQGTNSVAGNGKHIGMAATRDEAEQIGRDTIAELKAKA